MPDDIPAPATYTQAPPTHSTQEVYDTLIIGAGISGLACANRLRHKLPHHRLKILESRDRIGGRINSIYQAGCRLDTGANWIHGVGTPERPNPLVDILPEKRCRELTGGTIFRPAEEGRLAGDRGELLVPSREATVLTESLFGMIGELHEVSHSLPAEEAKATTVVDAIQNSTIFAQAFKELPEEFHSALRGLPQFVETMEAAPLIPLRSRPSDGEVEPVGMLEYAISDFEGAQVFLQDGYLPLVQELAKPVLDAISYETVVERIDYTASPVKVHTSKGTFTAKSIIVTVPLGVLKTGVPVFEPTLPKAKEFAIAGLGFGTLDKIFLLYANAWWEHEPYASYFERGARSTTTSSTSSTTHTPADERHAPDSFMGFTTSLPGVSISPSQPPAPGPRLLSYLNLHALSSQPVLCAFVSCSGAEHVEHLTDQEVQELAHETFRSWLPDSLPTPPDPKGVHVTRWAKDPWASGSYSYCRTGVSEKGMREEFAKPLRVGSGVECTTPVRPRSGEVGGEEQGAEDRWAVLRFAGEHTSAEHFATAHGALLSGWREADAVIREVEGEGM